MKKSILLIVAFIFFSGNLFSQVFNPDLTYGKVNDIEGNTYKTIQIGNETWMAENLRVSKYNDFSKIPYIEDSLRWRNATYGAYCYYQNDKKK